MSAASPAVTTPGASAGRPARLSTRGIFFAVAAAALLLRAGLVLYASPGAVMGPLDDDGGYLDIVHNLERDGVYRSGAFRAFRPPLFVLFLKGLRELHGDNWVMPARGWIAGLSMLVPLAAGWLARRWWGTSAGLIAFAWAAFHPHFLHYAFRVQNDSFFLPFAAWAAALMCAPAGAAGAAAAGAAAGLAVLGRSQFFGAAGVGFLWLLMRPSPAHRRRWAFVFLAVFAAVLSPWWIRNFQVFNRWVPLSTEGGYTFWVGNNPLADGGGDSPLSPAPAALDELAWDRWHYREGLAYIKEHPGRTAALAVKKLSRFWAVVPQVGGAFAKAVSALAFIPLFGAALAALFLSPRVRRWDFAPLLGLCAYYTAVESLFPALMRYRLPLEGLFIALAAGLPGLWAARRAGEARP